MKMSLFTPPHPAGRDSEAKGNEAFLVPAFSQIQDAHFFFFGLKQNNCRKPWKDGFFFSS